MNRESAGWIVSALGVLGLAVVSVMLGMSLMPSGAAIQKKLGTPAPVVLTWTMIGMTVVVAIALAAFLIATGVNKARRSQ